MHNILGILDLKKQFNIDEFAKLRNTFAPRCPNVDAQYLNEHKNIALGQRNLSLIDLSVIASQLYV